jgi:hypothetical protein
METDERVTGAQLSHWLRENESGIERWTKKGLLVRGEEGLFDLEDSVRSYVSFWRKLADFVERGKERIVSTDQLCEFLLLDRTEVEELALAGVLEPEAPDRFALLRSTKAFASEVRSSLGLD